MALISFNDYVVLWASEDDFPTGEDYLPYDAVDAILKDETADIVYQDTKDLTIEPTGESVGSDVNRGANDGKKSAFIKGMCNVSMTVPLRAFAGAGLEPHYAPVLRAANFATTVDTDNVLFTKSTRQVAAMTVYKFYPAIEGDDWRLRVATGVTGNVTFNYETGTEPTISFEGTGQYAELSTSAEFFTLSSGELALLKDGSTAITARTTGEIFQADQDPMTCSGMSVDIDDDVGSDFDAEPLYVSAVEINPNFSAVDINPVQGATTRQKGVTMRGRGARSEGSIPLINYTAAQIDAIISAATNGGEYPFEVEVSNSEGTITTNAPKMQFMREAEADNSGTMQYDLPIRFNGDWSDNALAGNELVITYSPTA